LGFFYIVDIDYEIAKFYFKTFYVHMFVMFVLWSVLYWESLMSVIVIK